MPLILYMYWIITKTYNRLTMGQTMEGNRIIVLSSIFLICLCFLCSYVYFDLKEKKSERIKQLIEEAEFSLSNVNKDK
jgi:hypothetical protein